MRVRTRSRERTRHAEWRIHLCSSSVRIPHGCKLAARYPSVSAALRNSRSSHVSIFPRCSRDAPIQIRVRARAPVRYKYACSDFVKALSVMIPDARTRARVCASRNCNYVSNLVDACLRSSYFYPMAREKRICKRIKLNAHETADCGLSTRSFGLSGRNRNESVFQRINGETTRKKEERITRVMTR